MVKTAAILLSGFLAYSLIAQPILLGRRQATRQSTIPPPLVTDTFDRTDADPMSTAASDGVSTWTSGPGALDSCRVLNNNLRASAGTPSGARILSPSFNANQSATMLFEGAGADLTLVGVGVRMQGIGDASGYLALVDDTTHVTINRVDDTGTLAYVPLGAQFTIPALAEGHTMTLGIVGSTLTLYINGFIQGTRSDATYATGQPWAYFTDTTGYINVFTAHNL